MAGLISNMIDKNNPLSDIKTVDPFTSQVDESKGTVQGQVDSLLSKGSPLVDRARAGAMATANKRGLLNSTMAAGAGEAAAIDSVLPIAGADAATFDSNRRLNDATQNAALQNNANALNQTANTQAGFNQQTEVQKTQGEQQQAAITKQGEINTGLQNLQGQQQLQNVAAQGEQERQTQELRGDQAKDIADMQAKNQLDLQNLKGDQATNVIQVESEYKNLLQTNVTAASFYTSMLSSMSAIAGNANIDAAGKQQEMDNMTQWLRSGLGLIGGISGYDLDSLLDFGV